MLLQPFNSTGRITELIKEAEDSAQYLLEHVSRNMQQATQDVAGKPSRTGSLASEMLLELSCDLLYLQVDLVVLQAVNHWQSQ